jgi:broad specificity phosphatase PhoE
MGTTLLVEDGMKKLKGKTMKTHQSHVYESIEKVTFHKIMRFAILLLFTGLLLGGCKPKEDLPEAKEGLTIVYIRHAEGGHNVKKDWETYTGIPEDQWPVWVGNHTIFSPAGRGRLERVPGKLKRYDFDFIASSSAWRSQNTILPYMKEVGAKGEVWPELAEIYHSNLILSPDLPIPEVKILGEGDPIELPAEEAAYFSLREDGLNNFKKPEFPRDHSDNVNETAACKVVIQRAVDLILERFDGTDKTILLAGHGSSGKGVLKLLLNDKLAGFPSIEHATIWVVQQQPNGEFKLKIFNDVPLD